MSGSAKGDSAAGAGDQEEVVRFLSSAASHGGVEVERIDTHISAVFLVGDTVYKLKRAVSYPYLDFSTASRRRQCCEAEVAINRRTAPDLYDGVIAVTREADGALALDGNGEPVDWLVVMKRFDQEMLLDRMAARGALSDEIVVRLADSVAAFHESAVRGPASDAAARMRRVVDGSLAEIERYAGPVFDVRQVERFSADLRRALGSVAPLLDRRARGGMVRHCHGDLHLRNVYLQGAAPTPFDAIEFDERLATIDTLYDYAFLVMDLVHRDMAAQANLALNRYLQRTDDYGGLAALRLFLACRAAVRAHTTASAAETQTNEADARRLRGEAASYLDLGTRFLRPGTPGLVALGGFSGSGKSTLARRLAPRLGAPPGAIVIPSDVVRKTMLGVAPEQRLSSAAYTEDVSRRVYRRLRERAGEALAVGMAVIADATFMNPDERERLERLAQERGAPFAGLWLDVPRGDLERRIAARGADASDADSAVLRLQLAAEIGPLHWTRVAAGGTTRDTLEKVLAALPAPFETKEGIQP